MDEGGIRAVLERIVSVEAPPSGIDVGLARIQGRRRLRWRRAGMAGAWALAAAAVPMVAVVVPHLASRPGVPLTGATGSGAAVQEFNPVVPYASFGWLPAGSRVTLGMTAGSAETFEAGSDPDRPYVGLDVYLPGRCNHTSGQVLALLRRHQHPWLTCRPDWAWIDQVSHVTLTNPVTAVAPPVNGHQAFWAKPVCGNNRCNAPVGYTPGGSLLVWSYARDAWASLAGRTRAQALAIADKVGFGKGVSQPIKFPAQLTGVPSNWHVSMVWSAMTSGVLAATQWTAGNPAYGPQFTITPSRPGVSGCNALQ
ncbi:MAG TPA: hypothetical protein VGS19_23605, partial [Streptosporangiaceae bacterium]|nr:hypothetical protein [Streptosporangiaceae bacterium]